jgi:hypothetical protein
VLKFNPGNASFEQIPKSSLTEKGILERYDLQKAILASWEAFKNELGMPSAFLIGEEINPDNSTQNSLDILAYDADDSSLVVIELKRDRNKLQLLQGLSYAAMVSNWDIDQIVSEIHKHRQSDHEELLDIVQSNPLSEHVKIVLIAESFDPEVIVTANWLSSLYSVNVFAYALKVHNVGEEIFIDVDQRFPLRELEDVYETRRTKRRRNKKDQDISWDDIVGKCRYKFAERAIKMCQKVKTGDPRRRRFIHLLSDFQGFDKITFLFRQKYLNVYLNGGADVDVERLKTKFSVPIEVSSWRDGYSFKIFDEQQILELVDLDERFEF